MEINRKSMKYLIIILLTSLISSCVAEQESYDSSGDDGTYVGTSVPYNDEDFESSLFTRTCPNVDITLRIQNGVYTINLTDSYRDGFVPHANVVTNHGDTGSTFDNNKFVAKDTWAIETTDTQLFDLRTLGVCGATASPASNGSLSNLSFVISEDFIVGQYGLGKARGSLVYGVDCTDGEFVEVCAYYMDLTKI